MADIPPRTPAVLERSPRTRSLGQPLPAERPAATALSPHRAPRYRSQVHAEARRKQQGLVLDLIRVGYSRAEAAARAHVEFETLRKWIKTDADFRVLYDEAKAQGREYVGDLADGLAPRAVAVLGETMDYKGKHPVIARLHLDAAATVLRGRGHLTDRHEVGGPGGKPIEVTLYDILQAARQRQALPGASVDGEVREVPTIQEHDDGRG